MRVDVLWGLAFLNAAMANRCDELAAKDEKDIFKEVDKVFAGAKTEREVNAGYRDLARCVHPDKTSSLDDSSREKLSRVFVYITDLKEKPNEEPSKTESFGVGNCVGKTFEGYEYNIGTEGFKDCLIRKFSPPSGLGAFGTMIDKSYPSLKFDKQIDFAKKLTENTQKLVEGGISFDSLTKAKIDQLSCFIENPTGAVELVQTGFSAEGLLNLSKDLLFYFLAHATELAKADLSHEEKGRFLQKLSSLLVSLKHAEMIVNHPEGCLTLLEADLQTGENWSLTTLWRTGSIFSASLNQWLFELRPRAFENCLGNADSIVRVFQNKPRYLGDFVMRGLESTNWGGFSHANDFHFAELLLEEGYITLEQFLSVPNHLVSSLVRSEHGVALLMQKGFAQAFKEVEAEANKELRRRGYLSVEPMDFKAFQSMVANSQ